MTSRQFLQRLFIFDLWCTRQLTDRISSSGSFRERAACRAFLSHIINLQRIWFNRVIDSGIKNVNPWFEIDLQDIKQEAKEVHKLWVNLIGDHDMDMDATIIYQSGSGVHSMHSFTDICSHLICHGQHHRAQISLLLKRSGIDPPPVDYSDYLQYNR
ncbi:MAG: hypothetical protein GVY08_05355 [Bacteroidetes bacterium]|jgi:uncharacterized damage-inducible protein DinB|nr:hypothetical protein [Bacteroidota bacterium]